MTKRIKALTFTDASAFIAGVDLIARQTVVVRKLEASRDAKIQAVRDEFADAIAVHNLIIENMALRCQNFAALNREELLPGKAKSADTTQATWGFRTGNPTLVLLNKKWSWKRVTDTIKTGWKDAQAFLRTPEIEADKDALKKLDDVKLAAVGLRIKQDETFFVEPKEQPTAQEARVA